MTATPACATRADARALDAADPLRALRSRFSLPDEVAYLDGNSLGAPPISAGPAVAQLQAEWAGDLIAGWGRGWWEAPVTVGERIAPLLGVGPGQVVVGDSTSVNVYKLAIAGARLRPDRGRILTEHGIFPTDRYLLQSVAAATGTTVDAVEPVAVVDALDAGVAVVVLAQVDHRTGAMRDLAATTAAVHRAGAVVLWDLSHSVGVVPLALDAADVDLAVGCSYKYLNGGPGAPSWCYAAHRHQRALSSPLPGWVGHADPFAMEAAYRPAPGMRRLLVGTPPLLSLRALDGALDAFDGVSVDELRGKSLALADVFVGLAATRLAPFGVTVLTPREHDRRGSQVSLAHPDAANLMTRLAEAGIVGDHRPPDVLRFGLAPLYVRYVDVWDAVDRLAALLGA